MKSFLWFVIFCSVGINQVFCQKDDVKLSLKEALEMAKQNYPAIKAKEAQKLAANTGIVSARSSFIPDLIVQGQLLNSTSNQVRGTTFSNEGTVFGMGGGIKNNGTNANDMVWSSYATALINWKVFTFGKVRSQIALAKADTSMAQSDYENEIFQQQIKVCDAYIKAILSDGIVQSQQSNLDRVDALRKVVIAYTSSGLRSGVDSSLVNAEYSKAYMLLLESQREAKEQKINLKEMLGLSTSGDLVLDTTVFLSKTPQNISLENKVNANPLLNYYQTIIDYNRLKTATIKRNALPSISLLGATFASGSGIADKMNNDGGFIYNKSFSDGVSFRAYDYFVGISTVWNITNSYRNQTEGRKQFYLMKEAEENYKEQKLELESELAKVNLRYINSKEIAGEAPIQLRAASDAFSQSKARYDNGLNTIIELTQTYALLNRSEVDLAVANGNTWLSLLLVAATSGNLDLFIQNIK